MLQKRQTIPCVNLEMDVLRSFVRLQDLGSLNRAADSVGRSQSAVSQQLGKLEEQIGQPLLRRHGRRLVFTEAGEVMLAYARRILELNDEAVVAASGTGARGTVRFGLPGDFAETWLPAALGRFKRAHPAVRLEAAVDRATVLLDRLDDGDLDLVLAFGAGTRSDSEVLARLPLVWIGSGGTGPLTGEPVPLVTFDARCVFRKLAISALEGAGRTWQVDFVSESLSGIWAAVAAGLGLTARTVVGLPKDLVVLDGNGRLPPLPAIELCLHDAGRPLSGPAARLRGILLDTLSPRLWDGSPPQVVPA